MQLYALSPGSMGKIDHLWSCAKINTSTRKNHDEQLTRRRLAGPHVRQSCSRTGATSTSPPLNLEIRATPWHPAARTRRRYGGGPNEHLDIFPTSKRTLRSSSSCPAGMGGAGQVRPLVLRAGVHPRGRLRGHSQLRAVSAVTVPQITMQMVRALAWTWRHIARHGGDPRGITVAGHSSAASLAPC